MSPLAAQGTALRCASAGRATVSAAASTATAALSTSPSSASCGAFRRCGAWIPSPQNGSGRACRGPLLLRWRSSAALRPDRLPQALHQHRQHPRRPCLHSSRQPQPHHHSPHPPPCQPQQRRILQTSCTSSSPAPPASSASSSSSSTSSSAFTTASTLEPRSRRRSFPRLRSHLRAAYLPAIVMGAAEQTRGSTGQHKPRANADTEHEHDHDHPHTHSHSHGLGFGHHHHHDNAYLLSKNRSDPGVRITNIGLLSNLAMAIAKFIGGWAFGSRAMIADAWHSVTDLASDILTLATVSWSIKPPTERFPLGFGKVESLGALGVSGMLIVGGCYMGWESAFSLYEHFNPEAAHTLLEHVGGGHGHSHSHSPAALGIPSIHAAWLAAGTILVKEWLYHATMKVAREKRSSVLASNAIHHRVDSLTGIVTLVAIVGANVVENAGWLDPVGGLIISVMVAHAGIGNMMDSFHELVDQSIDDEVKDSVRRQARRALDGFDASHDALLRDVNGVKSGQNYLIDLEMAVPGGWSVDHVREMEESIRVHVGANVRGVRRVRVRFVSLEEPDKTGKFDEFINTDPQQCPATPTSEAGGETEEQKANGHNYNSVEGQARPRRRNSTKTD